MPRTPGREASFAAYRRREGRGLAEVRKLGCAVGGVWPELLRLAGRTPRSPNPAAVAAFAVAQSAKIDFHCWLQWLMDEQLAGVQQAARRAGMALLG